MFKKMLMLVFVLALITVPAFAQSKITVLLHEVIVEKTSTNEIHQRILCIDGYKYFQMYQNNRSSTATLTQMYENNLSKQPRLAACKN